MTSSVDVLMGDFVIAIGCGMEGASNYARLFAEGDNFIFHPDPIDSMELFPTKPEAFSNWHYQAEQDVFNQIASSVDSMRVDSLTVLERDDGTPETRLKEDYVFTVFNDGVPSSYRGVATFSMLLEAGTWRMIRWADEQKPGSPSWGRYKGTVRQ